MTWIILALVGYFFWALVSIQEKYVVHNRFKNPYVYLVLITIVGSTGALLLIPFTTFYIPPPQTLLLIGIGGFFWFIANVPYVKALQIEDITRINMWWNLVPLFVLLIGWLTINEHLSQTQFLGFALLIIGALLASVHRTNTRFRFSRAFLLMVVSSLLFASAAVIFRAATQTTPFLIVFIISNGIMILFTPLFFINSAFRKHFTQSLNQSSLSPKLWGLIIGIALLGALGNLFNTAALSKGPAALVFAFEGFQTVFVFVLALLISIKNPLFLNESFDAKNFTLKLLALVFMVSGVVVIHVA